MEKKSEILSSMSYKLSCPVPKEQRPINEYIELAQSSFFNWPLSSLAIYREKIFKVFCGCFIFLLPVTNFFVNINHFSIKLLLINVTITTIFLIFILIRLILGWEYIKQRLYNPTVFYEESGWYDGRIWVKSKNILVQDRLIYKYQVMPTIKKLKDMFIFFSFLLLSFILILILA